MLDPLLWLIWTFFIHGYIICWPLPVAPELFPLLEIVQSEGDGGSTIVDLESINWLLGDGDFWTVYPDGEGEESRDGCEFNEWWEEDTGEGNGKGWLELCDPSEWWLLIWLPIFGIEVIDTPVVEHGL